MVNPHLKMTTAPTFHGPQIQGKTDSFTSTERMGLHIPKPGSACKKFSKFLVLVRCMDRVFQQQQTIIGRLQQQFPLPGEKGQQRIPPVDFIASLFVPAHHTSPGDIPLAQLFKVPDPGTIFSFTKTEKTAKVAQAGFY